MTNKCIICKVVFILMVVGALNWGLVGILQMDLVTKIFGPMTLLSRIVYILIGASGVVSLLALFKDCPACKK